MLTLAVTTANVEHGFSKLAYVKNKLRSTMSEERLEFLLLTSEKDILLNLSVDELVSKFASSGDRGLDLG